MKTGKSRMRFFVFLICCSVVSGAIFAFAFPHQLVGDAVDYDRIGWNLAQGNGFSLSDSAPYHKTLYRAPAYPFFLGAVYAIFGHSIAAVQSLQVLISALSCILLFYLAESMFNEKVAKASSFIFSIFPTTANYPRYILTETFFIFLLIATILCLSKAILKNRVRIIFCAGILFGFTVLCKAVMLLFFLPVFFALYLKCRKNPIKYFVIFLFGSFLIVTPWLARNYFFFKAPCITLHSGPFFLYRAKKLDMDAKKIKATVVYAISERLGKYVYPDVAGNPADFLDADLIEVFNENKELLKKGYSDLDVDRISREEGIKRIRKKPFAYLAGSLLEFIKLTGFTHLPLLSETHMIEKFNTFKNGQLILSATRGISRILAYPILVLAIMGMWLDRERWKNWILILSLIIYTNLIHSLLIGCVRYAVPLIPFYLIFVSHTVNKIRERQNA